MGFTVEQLQELGLLDENLFVRPLKDLQGKFLRPDQELRVAGFTRIADVGSVLRDLQGDREDWPIVLKPDQCYPFTAACWVQWREHNVFPHDTARCPEPHKDHILPSVVKESMVRIHIPYDSREDLQHILRLFSGEELALEVGPRGESVPARQWDRMLQDIQRSPIETRLCRFRGCNEKVVTTVAAARNAIKVYGLIPADNRFASAFFRTHTLCVRHAQDRDERLAAKRAARDPSDNNDSGGGKGRGRRRRPRRENNQYSDPGPLAPPVQEHLTLEDAQRLRDQARFAQEQQEQELLNTDPMNPET
jgi:hypothetical protein